MDITCAACQGKFKIADDKIPSGRTASFACPNCRTRIAVNAGPGPARERVSLHEVDTGAYNPADRPFDFIEEEGKTALVCEHQPALHTTITATLHQMEYQITVAENARDALKRMRYHSYDIVVVDEDFDTHTPEANGVLIYLERMTMNTRRNMYATLVSSRHRTMDNMTALMKSVNLIVNTKNIDDLGKIMSRGLTEHLALYRVYREKLKETGRA
jgi:CheY-like chemotaxis protein